MVSALTKIQNVWHLCWDQDGAPSRDQSEDLKDSNEIALGDRRKGDLSITMS